MRLTPRQIRKQQRHSSAGFRTHPTEQQLGVKVKACLGDTVQICKTFTVDLPTSCPEGQVVCGSSEPGSGTICCDPNNPPPGFERLRFVQAPTTPRQHRKAQRRTNPYVRPWGHFPSFYPTDNWSY